ncbi:MAG: hypothetical protein NZ602_12685 [Thermoguttaceae bacterium]|nr:hypothetical protein [Thermoguttaceae bacterium]MDW8039638.1 hypothetical protein [Thermoguttaceae bacterium]
MFYERPAVFGLRPIYAQGPSSPQSLIDLAVAEAFLQFWKHFSRMEWAYFSPSIPASFRRRGKPA